MFKEFLFSLLPKAFFDKCQQRPKIRALLLFERGGLATFSSMIGLKSYGALVLAMKKAGQRTASYRCLVPSMGV